MNYSLFLRTLMAIAVLLQPHNAFDTSVLCPKPHCVYLPVMNNPIPVTAKALRTLGGGKFGSGPAFGEVVNNSYSPVYNVVVQVTFVNVLNLDVSSFTNTTLLTATFPGQVNPFIVSHKGGFVQISDTKVLSWDITPTVTLSNLTVVASHAYTVPYAAPIGYPTFYVIVTGTLRNDTGRTLKDGHIYVWNVNPASIDHKTISQVAPGAMVTFTAGLIEGVLPTDTIHIVAQGVVSP